MNAMRNAELTREKILEVAATEMYHKGYQATSIGEVLKKAEVSKGALYHHFPTKQDLGYAVLDELFAKNEAQVWDKSLEADNPLEGLIEMLRAADQKMSGDRLEYGCPINNLAQEMSPLDEGFRQRVEAVLSRWRRRMTEAFLRAQRDGYMRQDIDAEQVACFVIATSQGAIGLAKNAQNNAVFLQAVQGLVEYLETLRPRIL